MNNLPFIFRMLSLLFIALSIIAFAAVAEETNESVNQSENLLFPMENPSGMPAFGADLPPEGKLSKVDTSSINQKWLDVPYGNLSETEKMDFYLPNNGTGPFPVIISIHGGGFALGDKVGSDLEAALSGLDRGYAVASMNYRLSGEAAFPAQINDVKAAIRFIRANAETYNLNPEKIAVWGGSAGGALSAFAGTSGGIVELADPAQGNMDQSDRVQAVVDWYGPISFLTMDDQFNQSGVEGQVHNTSDSFESKLMGEQITLIPEKVAKANPETYISPDDPPFFIQHGDADTSIPYQQSEELARKLKAVIGDANVTFELLEGLNHADAGFRTAENLNKTLDFLDLVLKN